MAAQTVCFHHNPIKEVNLVPQATIATGCLELLATGWEDIVHESVVVQVGAQRIQLC
jgi:hypothetical protein